MASTTQNWLVAHLGDWTADSTLASWAGSIATFLAILTALGVPAYLRFSDNRKARFKRKDRGGLLAFKLSLWNENIHAKLMNFSELDIVKHFTYLGVLGRSEYFAKFSVTVDHILELDSDYLLALPKVAPDIIQLEWALKFYKQ